MTAPRVLLLVTLGLSAGVCIPYGVQRTDPMDPIHGLGLFIKADSTHFYAVGEGHHPRMVLARRKARLWARHELMQTISTEHSWLFDHLEELSDSSAPLIRYPDFPSFPDLPGHQTVNLEAITLFYEDIEQVENEWVATSILKIHRDDAEAAYLDWLKKVLPPHYRDTLDELIKKRGAP